VYSNDIITIYYVEQAVALVDMYGFVTRDEEWEIPVESQTLGFLQIDAENKTGEYWLQLPAKPAGALADVDNDGGADKGVQVFAVAYWPNLTGGPFSEGDDRSRGWPSYLASVQTDTENADEVIGGKLVAWAPDDRQAFPTGFGDDGLLFTADDPVGPLPAGYSVIDLDRTPFGISQEAEPSLQLYEPKDVAIKDYSTLSYTEAFDQLFEKASTEWAFNGAPGKDVDWPALYDEIAPRVAEAEENEDPLAFYQALHAFTLSIPDGHTGLSGGEFGAQDFQEKTAGGYGFAIRELEVGKAIVVYVTPGGPAARAGMQVGAEVTAFNGEPIRDAIGKVEPYAGPFSQETSRRYQQARYLLRAPLGTSAEIGFVNPGGAPLTTTLTVTEERQSFSFTSIYKGQDPNALPVESRILDSGLGYIKMNSNYDDLGLIIRLFERALKTFQANGVPAVIIDMRQNAGGAPLGLAGFFYDQEIPLGQLEYYSETTGDFEPEGLPDKILPNQNRYTFDKIAVLVGQACASACEIEAYGFSKVPGAIVVGYYPSAGVEAEVARGQFLLPEGMSFQIPTGRFVNPDGSIFLEGVGVQPTLRVPLTAANLLSSDDVELRAAEDALLGVGAGDLKIEGGPVILTPAGTQSALQSGAEFLDSLAAETYPEAELSQAGRTYTYTVSLDGDRRLIWYSGWCAIDEATLRSNFSHITLEFFANGAPVELRQFLRIEGPNGDHFCRFYLAVAFRWPRGQTVLETKVTFDAAINDGINAADYPQGAHTYRYVVTLP
jgi:C-terminal processing protease CtpA/Prc